jgi:antitoxin component YwqK of YwqJK toxin-antitoxin module
LIKKSFILVFILSLSIFGFSNFSSDTINKTNPVNGRKTGYWIVTGSMSKINGYNSEAIIEEGVYLNSRKNGLWIKYWPNGNPKSKIKYKNGRSFGDYVTFFQNGNIEEKGEMNGGLLQGGYELYWPNGKIRQEKKFNLYGNPEGGVSFYYENGQPELKFEVVDGKENGDAIWFYENGDVKKEVIYNKGLATSTKEYKEIHEHQDITDPLIEKGPKLLGTFNNANSELIDNYGKTYDEDKNILMDGEFKNSFLYNGRHYIYDEYGLLEEIKVFKNGVYVGNGIIGK